MSLHSSIAAYIETKTAITDLIGTRFYPQIAKGSMELPHAIYSRASVQRNPASAGSTGLLTTVLRIVSFADGYDGAVSLADEFRKALDGKRGTVGDQFFSQCTLIDEGDSLEPLQFAQNDGPHFVSQDFQITHRESLPTL